METKRPKVMVSEGGPHARVATEGDAVCGGDGQPLIDNEVFASSGFAFGKLPPVSFDDATKTLTVTPTKVWVNSIDRVLNAPSRCALPNDAFDGFWSFYFGLDFELHCVPFAAKPAETIAAHVCDVFWSQVENRALMLVDDRHEVGMSIVTRKTLAGLHGLVVHGCDLLVSIDEKVKTPKDDNVARGLCLPSTIRDVDIAHTIGGPQFDIYYQREDGWHKQDARDNYLFIHDGGVTRPFSNQVETIGEGETERRGWVLREMPTKGFVSYFLYAAATLQGSSPFLIAGPSHAALDDAVEAWFVSGPVVPLAQIVLEVNSRWANSMHRCRVAAVKGMSK